jgi:hypothetical protein
MAEMERQSMKNMGILMMALAVALVCGMTWTAASCAQTPAGAGNVSAGGASKDVGGKTGIADKEDAALVEKQKAAYAMDTCVVSGNKLGSDGKPVDYLIYRAPCPFLLRGMHFRI